MPVPETLVQVIVPCPTCGGTGQRPAETYAGGVEVRAVSGRSDCRECGGVGGLPENLTLAAFAQLLAQASQDS